MIFCFRIGCFQSRLKKLIKSCEIGPQTTINYLNVFKHGSVFARALGYELLTNKLSGTLGH